MSTLGADQIRLTLDMPALDSARDVKYGMLITTVWDLNQVPDIEHFAKEVSSVVESTMKMHFGNGVAYLPVIEEAAK